MFSSFLTLLCCEFSDESLQGPPEKTNKEVGKDADKDDKRSSKKSEFIASIEDRDGATAIALSQHLISAMKENVIKVLI
ncbi:hypothetical protein NQ314_012226 [Rhamnusium bicolor]|uniref:Uncharacterized protein n=1 Tax=Rhamnusium bicolor TaxID=1586634 RepID=A0AAV8XCW2_9CUCU|nr:hypothetical protein NQ314_012226 [Rhamnusium bicolor]